MRDHDNGAALHQPPRGLFRTGAPVLISIDAAGAIIDTNDAYESPDIPKKVAPRRASVPDDDVTTLRVGVCHPERVLSGHGTIERLVYTLHHGWKHSRKLDLSDEAVQVDLEKHGSRQ